MKNNIDNQAVIKVAYNKRSSGPFYQEKGSYQRRGL